MTDNEVADLKRRLAALEAAQPTRIDPKADAEWADQMHQIHTRS